MMVQSYEIQIQFVLFLACLLCPIYSFRPKKIYAAQPRTRLCLKEIYLETNDVIATTDDYKNLIQNSNIFVDKSIFIRDLMVRTGQATVFSTPPGWGKTTILNMLKLFFQLQLDNEYEMIRNTSTYDTYAFFTKGEISWTTPPQMLLNPLIISEHDDIIKKHLGRYPVIYLNLKNVTGMNWYEIWSRFREAVTETFRQHSYMTECITKAICDLTKARDMMHKFEVNLRQFRIYLSGKETRRVPMKNSIRFLSQILNWYYHRQVFLLIDDYDTPLLNIFHYPHMIQKDITKLSSFMTGFYKLTFRNNVHVKKAILTGTFCIDNITQFPPKIQKYNVINTPFPYVFGFTQTEVEAIFYRLKIPAEALAQARDWYNGFKAGLQLVTSVYTPSSILRYQKLGCFRNYYERRQNIDILEHTMNLKPLRYTFERLVNNHEIPIPFPKFYVDENSLVELKNLIYHDYGDDSLTVEVWQSAVGYLYGAGYLTAVSAEIYNKTQFIVSHLQLVNRQIREEITDKLFSRYHYDYGVSADMVEIAVDKLVEFAMTDETSSSELAHSLRLIYHFCDNLFVNETDPRAERKSTHFLFSMLNYLCLMVCRKYNFNGQVFDESTKPDIILYTETRAIVLDIKFNADYACNLLRYMKQYEDLEDLLNRYENIDIVKFIAVDLNCQKNVKICAEVRSIKL